MKQLLCLTVIAASLIQSAITCAVAGTEYVPGLSYGKQDHLRQVSSLAIGKDNFLVVAAINKVFIFDPAKEESVRSFDPGFASISALAVEGDTIYVFSRKTEVKDLENNGRKFKIQVPIGALCKKFTWDGTFIGDLDLQGLKDVINAKVVGGKVYVADFGGTRQIRIFDAKTGSPLQAVGKDLRLCCGLLDFAVDPKSGDVLIGNMGAFSLERYSPQSGAIKFAFGKRGTAAEDFQGCCNPVSAAVLPDGNLVVVEKDPSRVKIYTPQGKLVFPLSDLQSLTNGCNRVSVVVDTKGRVYLGVNNAEHFVLQYVPKS